MLTKILLIEGTNVDSGREEGTKVDIIQSKNG